MLERLRALGVQRQETTPEPDTFQGAPTTVEPLPPADALVPEDHRPTIRQIPADVQRLVRGRADEIAAGAIAGSATSKLERVPMESTPAPLPPSPEAEQAAASWFESVPTSPSVAPDMGPFSPGTDSGVGGSVITPLHERAGANIGYHPTRPITRARGPRAGTVIAEKPWAIPSLIAATSLAVGMVLGALVFGGDDSPAAAPTTDAGVCTPCPEPPAADSPPPDEPARRPGKSQRSRTAPR